MIWLCKKLLFPLVEGSSGNGPSGSEEEASCNTPPSSRFGTCIDYLKFTFPNGFRRNYGHFSKLLNVLRVDFLSAEGMKPMHGFTDVYRLAPGTNIAYGGTMTIRKSGDETTMLEMSGEGCREFEDRYFSDLYMDDPSIERVETVRKGWIELIETCLEMGGECKRVDLPTDDFSGNITVQEIREKVAHHYYATKMRALETTDDSRDLKDVKTVKDSKLSGYSATFGTRKSLQLCIYDKLAERLSAGIDPRVNSWVRYEVRFYHERAEQEILELLKALKEGNESTHIVGALAALFEFKEPTKAGAKHRNDAKTWAKWTELVKYGSEFNGFAISPRVMSIESNASWLMKEGAKSFLRVLASLDGNGISTIGSALALKAIGKMTKADLQFINQYRKRLGHSEFKTLKELENYFFSLPDLIVEFNEDITQLLFEKGTKRELVSRRDAVRGSDGEEDG